MFIRNTNLRRLATAPGRPGGRVITLPVLSRRDRPVPVPPVSKVNPIKRIRLIDPRQDVPDGEQNLRGLFLDILV